MHTSPHQPHLVTLLLIILFVFAAQAQKPIHFNSSTTYRVVIPNNPTPSQQLAAEQLVRLLGKQGVTNISLAKEYRGGHGIFIGNSKFTEKAYRQNAHLIHDDGFLLHTDGKNLYIIGNHADAALNGVYHLLENYFGYMLTDGETPCQEPQPNDLTLSIHEIQNPSFRYRETLHPLPIHHSSYADWHKLHNRKDFQQQWGLFVHTFQHLIPVNIYFDSHPEWFSEINGQRIRDGQLCLSNPELFDTLCQNLEKRIAAEPHKQYWSVSQNDNYGSCTCPNCKHLDSLYGGPSGTMLHFVNRVAERFPDKTISMLAYQQTRKAPKNIKPADNVNIMFCSIECQRQIPIADNPADASFQHDMEDWTALTDNILLWDYVVQFRNYLDPFPNLHVLQPNLQNFHRHGIPMMFEQGSNINISDSHEWRTFLIAHLLWNVNLDVDSLRDRFLDAHYGKNRAPFIKQYYDTLQQALIESKQWLNIYGYPMDARHGYLSPSRIQFYQSLFKKAYEVEPFDALEQPTPYDVQRYDDRLRLLELAIDYVRLDLSMSDLSPELSYFTYNEKGERIVRQEMPDLADKFVIDCNRLGVTKLDEIKYTPEQLRGNIDNYISKTMTPNIALHKTVSCNSIWSNAYDVGGPKALTDGKLGMMNYHYNWLGFEGEDMDVTIDLDSIQEIRSVGADFLYYPLSWIFVPKQVICYVSTDGVNWAEVSHQHYENEESLAECKIVGFHLDEIKQLGRYVRIKAESLKVNPEWHRGVGLPCWIFCDEIRVQ